MLAVPPAAPPSYVPLARPALGFSTCLRYRFGTGFWGYVSRVPKLSRRETQVAQLVAERLTNREIAERLFLSERTAEYHVEQIRNKLGFHSRAEIADWVAQHAPAEPPPNRLPPQLTSFVGRSADLRAVSDLLSRARLVTITGAGGTGKTRLAVEAAARALPGHPDGAWFVDLQALQDPQLLEAEVAAALAVADLDGELAVSRRLIVLDNCEQLAAACRELVTRLLTSCPALRLLATSREPLHVAGEAVWPLRPLPPDEAATLFLERAALAAPDVQVAAADPALVRGICEDLDGIPLAIELAAARAGVMSLVDIRERLKSRFRVLIDSARGARQRSLAAAVAWSYELLSEPERDLFRKLGIFAGGFRLDSAEAVLGGDIADVLDRLVEQSMVVAERNPDRPTRYRLLVTMREFARERLLETNGLDVLEAAHTRRFVDLARLAGGQLQGPEQAYWMKRIEDELDEYRTAIERTLDNDPEIALAIAVGLDWFWGMRGRMDEGRRLLGLGLARCPTRSFERAQALIGAGWLARMQDDQEAGRRLHAESVEILRELDDPIELGTALVWDAEAAFTRGDAATARAGWEEAIDLLAPLGTSMPLAYAHLELSIFGLQDRRADWVRDYAQRSLAMMVELGNTRAVALSQVMLALAATFEGRFPEARAQLQEAGARLAGIGALADIAYALTAGVVLDVAEGAVEEATVLAGATQAVRQATGWKDLQFKPVWDPALEQARRQLGDAAYEAAWQRGLELDQEEALELLGVRAPC